MKQLAYTLFYFSQFLQLMQRSKDNREEFFNSFRKLKETIDHLLVRLTYEQICYIYRSLSHHLIYFINCVHLGLSGSKLIEDELKECIKTILVLVNSTEYEIYGHSFPLLGFIVKKYQKLTENSFESLNQNNIRQRTQKNDESVRYKSERVWLNHREQINFLKSQNFPPFLQAMRLQSHAFPNQQCVCCSRIFIQDFEVFNLNPYFSTLIGLNYVKEFNRTQLQKYLTAVCNEGGGVILVGTHESENIIRIKGIRFTSEEQIHKAEKLLYSVIQKMKPGCYCLIEKVIVQPNYAVLNSTNCTEEYLRICLRISVFPIQKNKLTYIKIQNSQQIKYKIYKLDKKKKPIEVVCHQNIKQQISLYKLIGKIFRKKKQKINSHYPIICFKPENNYSEEFIDRFFCSQFVFKQIQNQEDRRIVNGTAIQENLVDQPVFKYQYSSLLVVPSKNYNNVIANFCKKLTQIKEAFEVCKPFMEYFQVFDPTSRSIRLLTHRMKPKQLKGILQDLQRLDMVKQSVIKVMSVSKYLQTDYHKLTKEKQKRFQEEFMERYKQNLQYEISTLNNNEKCKIFLFNGYCQSIFAFLLLQRMQIRSYFVEEGKMYKKKNQKNGKE